MAAYHVVLVHFPIALWMTATLAILLRAFSDGELAQAVRKGTVEQQLHELGDVLAWLSSLANQLGLSLDEAAQRYVTDPP